MRKSTWGWLGATKNPRETPSRAPHLFERLEPRLLLSVVWENVQPTDPATPEEYAIYLEQQAEESQASQLSVAGGELGAEILAQEEWLRYAPSAEQTVISMISDDAGTRATVTLTFPDAGYRVLDWGTVQQEIGRLAVNVQVEHWTGPSEAVVTKLSHEYDFGLITGGPREFAFYAWEQYIESRWFTAGMEFWVPYVPTAEQTSIFIVPGETGMKANVTVKFGPEYGYYQVREWGTVQRVGNTFTVNAEIERLEGVIVVSEPATISHEYDLGALPAGGYVFEFRAWDQPVESREFQPGSAQWVPYVPTAEQTGIFIAPSDTGMKATVTLAFRFGYAYAVREWGTIRQVGNTFTVNAEVEWLEGVLVLSGAMIESHEYDLGTLAAGDYVFEFRVWDQLIESREFRPGSEQWVQYRPTAEQTNILVMADGAGGTKARVTIDFVDAGYRVHDWGTVRQTENTFSVSAEVEHWTGPAAAVITRVSHDYDLGSLPDGNYEFRFNAWQEPVESKEFATPVTLRPVYRFWSPVLSRHFYTLSTAERDKLINNYSDVWTYEQVAYYAFAIDAEPGTVPVYRFWSGTLKTHFYTASEAERGKLLNNYSQTWADEGIAFYVYPYSPGFQFPVVGTQPVHRLWSSSLGSHFYTASWAEMNKLLSLPTQVWQLEGIAWYAYTAAMLDRQLA